MAYTTQAQIRAAFWRDNPGFTKLCVRSYIADERRYTRRAATQNEYPTDTRVAFVDYVDMLARDGQISEALAQRVTL